jgi:hypothetical protein
LLAQLLAAMPTGGTVVLTIPLTPYRCPPGPHELACLLTDWLRVNKSGSKLLVLQANPDFVTDTGLPTANGGRFAPVDVLSYASTAAPLVHLIGDASATTQPKAGHIANQEAKVCADALVRLFNGESPDPAPVTNSACFSTITMSQASWLTAVSLVRRGQSLLGGGADVQCRVQRLERWALSGHGHLVRVADVRQLWLGSGQHGVQRQLQHPRIAAGTMALRGATAAAKLLQCRVQAGAVGIVQQALH